MAFWPKSMTKTGYKSMVNKKTFHEEAIEEALKKLAKEMAEVPTRYYSSSIMDFTSGGLWAPFTMPIAKVLLPTITCQYCENLYPGEIINKYHTCPTCGGDWPKEKK